MTVARHAEFLAPLRSDPSRTAVLLDVDGTLAPIAEHADEATVPEPVRELLVRLAARFGMVACISGRRAAEARRMVAVDGLHYVGNHGTEIIRRGRTDVEQLPVVAEWEPRVRAVAADLLAACPEAEALGVWLEDKGPIQGLHWRGSSDEGAAEALVGAMGRAAEERGLAVHEGRKVLELRPPLRFDKGQAVRWLLERREWDAAVYAGDDRTDLDAFAGLWSSRDDGKVSDVVCVVAAAEESPAELVDAGDIVVDGTDGVRELLEELLRP
ncbi:MAG: trehalose-phosphatase [Solirubrobacteraceae bacterium]